MASKTLRSVSQKNHALIDEKAYIKEYAKGTPVLASVQLSTIRLWEPCTYASVNGGLQWAPQMLSYRLQ